MRQTLEIAGLLGRGARAARARRRRYTRWRRAGRSRSPRGLAARIDPADPADPLARQFVPSEEELLADPDELEDPIGDLAHRPVPGIVHRYPDRALLHADRGLRRLLPLLLPPRARRAERRRR